MKSVDINSVKYRLSNPQYSAILHSYVKLGGTHDILVNGYKVRFTSEEKSLTSFYDGEIQIVHTNNLIKARKIDDNIINPNILELYKTPECQLIKKNKWKQNGIEGQTFELDNGMKNFKRTFTWDRDSRCKMWEFNYSNGNYIGSVVLRHFLFDTTSTGNGHNFTSGVAEISVVYRGPNQFIDQSIHTLVSNDGSFMRDIDGIHKDLIQNSKIHKILIPSFYCIFYFNQDYMNIPSMKKKRIRTTQPEIIIPKTLTGRLPYEIANSSKASLKEKYIKPYRQLIKYIYSNNKIKSNILNNDLSLLNINNNNNNINNNNNNNNNINNNNNNSQQNNNNNNIINNNNNNNNYQNQNYQPINPFNLNNNNYNNYINYNNNNNNIINNNPFNQNNSIHCNINSNNQYVNYNNNNNNFNNNSTISNINSGLKFPQLVSNTTYTQKPYQLDLSIKRLRLSSN